MDLSRDTYVNLFVATALAATCGDLIGRLMHLLFHRTRRSFSIIQLFFAVLSSKAVSSVLQIAGFPVAVYSVAKDAFFPAFWASQTYFSGRLSDFLCEVNPLSKVLKSASQP
jgi:hypothetical protein